MTSCQMKSVFGTSGVLSDVGKVSGKIIERKNLRQLLHR